MSIVTVDKDNLEVIFKRLRSIPTNKVCFDCTAKNPTWASITYGVFICIDCSAVHRSLGVHLTFVRSTQLDTNWSWLQVRQMQIGGNANAESFFQQHNCTTKDAQQKYNSRAAHLYREKLHNAAMHSIEVHGHSVHIDNDVEFDSKEEHKNDLDYLLENSYSKISWPASDVPNDEKEEPEENVTTNERKGPSVNMNVSGIPDRRSLIGSRKPQTKKLGLANKRGSGLGAQRSSASFAEVEKEAELSEKLKVQNQKENEEHKKELDQDQIASVRLAYEDLGIKQKREEEKLKAIDPKKATQMERLGMGLGSRTGISHSALSDMKTIHQENSTKAIKSSDVEGHDFFDDFGFSSNSSTSSFSPLYKNTSQSSRSVLGSLGDNEDTFKMSFDNGFNTSSTLDNSFKSQSNFNNSLKIQNNNTKKNTNLPSDPSTDAQKKFGGAKSISSDQYFSDGIDNSWEKVSNLSRFEGSTSISSADYFGRNEQTHQRGYALNSAIQAPDLEEVRESVKQGVSKVAGRLSSLASGVISSIQDKYGGY